MSIILKISMVHRVGFSIAVVSTMVTLENYLDRMSDHYKYEFLVYLVISIAILLYLIYVWTFSVRLMQGAEIEKRFFLGKWLVKRAKIKSFRSSTSNFLFFCYDSNGKEFLNSFGLNKKKIEQWLVNQNVDKRGRD